MFRINVTGTESVMSDIKKLEDSLKRLDLTNEGEIFEQAYIHRIFVDGRRSDGSRIRYKNGKYTNASGQILTGTGWLRNHITLLKERNGVSIVIVDDQKKIAGIENRMGRIFAPTTGEVGRLRELINRKIKS